MAGYHPNQALISGNRKRALLIAVRNNYVEGFLELTHVQHDAKELQRFLIEVSGYRKDDIVLMMDHESIPKQLWPTKINIRRQIQLFVRGVSNGDHLFFYYSGHGHQVTCLHNTESDGLDEVLYTCNRKEIKDNDLKKWLINPLPHGCKLFALLDSCHSQTMLDLDHYTCNEPGGREHTRQYHKFSALPTFRRVLQKPFRSKFAFRSESLRSNSGHYPGRKGNPQLRRSALTTAPHELRGRPVSPTPVSITALSAGSSPLRPLSLWVPFMENIRLVLSPPPLPKCNGKCPLPTAGDVKYAHVICLSACRDNEIAVDDWYNETVTMFFISHLRENRKSTLQELLLAIRQRVNKITEARQAWDMETKVISRKTTFANSSRIEAEWTPQIIRRRTDIPEDCFQFTPSGTCEENEIRYSQTPSASRLAIINSASTNLHAFGGQLSSHYRLNLDELVDL